MLREYQENGLAEIKALYKQGIKKVLLWLDTGAGKTVLFSEVLKGIHERKKFAILIVRGRKLVRQAHERLIRERVPHGVFMAGHPHHYPDERIQLCSVDTLRARKIYPKADLIVVDEVHMLTSKDNVEFASKYPNAYFLPVTATPFGNKSLRHFADVIVRPIGMQELINQGYLVDGKYYAPSEPDLRNVKIDSKTKDYNQRELSTEMDQLKIVGNIVEEWKKYGENRPTICFAVTVSHSQHLAEEFCRAGIPALHCDANSPDEFRERAIQRLAAGHLKIITNVGLFGVGVDMPFLSCEILARPTQSLNLYLQQMGRGLRPYENKSNCIFLDHAGNILRHGFPTDEREPSLDGKTKRITISAKRCEECFAVVAELPCKFCGWTRKPSNSESAERVVRTADGSLSELSKTDPIINANPVDVRKDISTWDEKAAQYGFKFGWVWHQCKNKYGNDIAKFYLGDRFRRQK